MDANSKIIICLLSAVFICTADIKSYAVRDVCGGKVTTTITVTKE